MNADQAARLEEGDGQRCDQCDSYEFVDDAMMPYTKCDCGVSMNDLVVSIGDWKPEPFKDTADTPPNFACRFFAARTQTEEGAS